MCDHVDRDDFVPSRVRLRDLPGLLLLHRPVRCPYCASRCYAPWFSTHRSTWLGSWKAHYAVWLLLAAVLIVRNRPAVETFLATQLQSVLTSQIGTNAADWESQTRPTTRPELGTR